jgi:hypothetical protein
MDESVIGGMMTEEVQQARARAHAEQEVGFHEWLAKRSLDRASIQQRKLDTLSRWRRAFGLQQIESWVTTCALRDDVDGPALLGPGGSDVGDSDGLYHNPFAQTAGGAS